MLPYFLDRLTPRAYPRTRLLSAALVWSLVGVFLTGKGIWMSHQSSWTLLLISILTGLNLGFVKSQCVFDKVAAKVVAHIGDKPARACLGGLFSFKNWALILVMVAFGRIIGALPVNPLLKTGIYVMVGSGLAFSSRLMWSAWIKPVSPELRRI